jgi:hypothetical protein
VLPWAPGALRYLELARDGQRVSLSSTNGADWDVMGARRQPAEGPVVWSLVSTWAGARIGAFHDEPAAGLALWGLEVPAASITIATVPEPGTNAVEAGEALTFRLGRVGGSGEVFALEEATKTVWQVPAALLDSVRAESRHYRARAAFPLAPAEVRSVTFQQGESSLAWERPGTNGEAWVCLATQKLERAEVEGWLEHAGRLRAVEWVADDPADLAAYGLAPPSALLTIGLTGESGLAKVLLLGGSAGPGLVHALVKGQDAVFTLEEAERDKLLSPLYKSTPSHAGAEPEPSGVQAAAP